MVSRDDDVKRVVLEERLKRLMPEFVTFMRVKRHIRYVEDERLVHILAYWYDFLESEGLTV